MSLEALAYHTKTHTRTHKHTNTHARVFFKDAKLAYGTRLGAYEDATRIQNREAEAARQMAQTVRYPRLHGWIHTCSSSSSGSGSSGGGGVLRDDGFEFVLLQCVVRRCWCVLSKTVTQQYEHRSTRLHECRGF
jgi:hypothetical protein